MRWRRVMDEDELRRKRWMLAVYLVDLSPDLCAAVRHFYAAQAPPLREKFLHIFARAQAEGAPLVDTPAPVKRLHELVHRLSNDLTLALGTLELLEAMPEAERAATSRERLRDAT